MSNEFMRREVIIKPRYVVYFLMLLAILFLFSYAVHSARVRNLATQLSIIEAQVVAANKKTEELERMLAYRATNEYVERVARDKFGYMMQGDIRYMMEGMVAPQYLAPAMPVTFAPTENTNDAENNVDMENVGGAQS